MKKILVLILIFLIVPTISAVEFDMKSNFSQGETLVAKLSGNFIEPIAKSDIIFYRGHKRTPLDFSVKEIDNDFYISAQLFGKTEGGYSVVVENAKYLNVNQIIEENLEKNFTITNESAAFFIEPAFVVTNESFSIDVQNLKNEGIIVSSNLKKESEEKGFFESLFEWGGEENTTTATLKSGEKKTLNFGLSGFSSGLNIFELTAENTTYEIPVYVNLNKSEQEDLVRLEFQPNELNITISTKSNTSRIVYLSNLGNIFLENVSITFSESLKPYLNPSEYDFETMDENSSEKMELIFSSDNKSRNIEGQIKAKVTYKEENFYAYIAVFLNFVDSFLPPVGENESNPLPQTCSEFGGSICSSTQECNGTVKYVSDGVCCVGSCKEIQKTLTGKVIGWGIVVIILILLTWFYLRRYRKTSNVVDLMKAARGKR